MWELLIDPAKSLITSGLEAFMRSAERRNLQLAVRDRILREVRFNKALLSDIIDSPKMHADQERALIASLRTAAFDDLDSGLLPLAAFFEGPLNSEAWPMTFRKAKTYRANLAQVNTLDSLLERVYHRIRIVKTMAAVTESGCDLAYIVYMLIAFEMECAPTASGTGDTQ